MARLLQPDKNFLPNHVGFASGITIGLAVTFGGITTPLLGWIADIYSVQTALQSLIVLPVLAIALALTLLLTRKVWHKSMLRRLRQ